MDAFVAAQQRILANLEPDEKALLQTTTCAEDVLAEVQDIEKKHGQTSSARKLSKKMEPFVRGMQQYGDALNVLAGTHQALGLLWGSVRVLLRVRDLSLGLVKTQACSDVASHSVGHELHRIL